MSTTTTNQHLPSCTSSSPPDGPRVLRSQVAPSFSDAFLVFGSLFSSTIENRNYTTGRDEEDEEQQKRPGAGSGGDPGVAASAAGPLTTRAASQEQARIDSSVSTDITTSEEEEHVDVDMEVESTSETNECRPSSGTTAAFASSPSSANGQSKKRKEVKKKVVRFQDEVKDDSSCFSSTSDKKHEHEHQASVEPDLTDEYEINSQELLDQHTAGPQVEEPAATTTRATNEKNDDAATTASTTCSSSPLLHLLTTGVQKVRDTRTSTSKAFLERRNRKRLTTDEVETRTASANNKTAAPTPRPSSTMLVEQDTTATQDERGEIILKNSGEDGAVSPCSSSARQDNGSRSSSELPSSTSTAAETTAADDFSDFALALPNLTSRAFWAMMGCGTAVRNANTVVRSCAPASVRDYFFASDEELTRLHLFLVDRTFIPIDARTGEQIQIPRRAEYGRPGRDELLAAVDLTQVNMAPRHSLEECSHFVTNFVLNSISGKIVLDHMAFFHPAKIPAYFRRLCTSEKTIRLLIPNSMLNDGGGSSTSSAAGSSSSNGMNSEPPEPPVEESHYEVLNVSQDASLAEIRKAYRKRALETHPDKAADSNEAFLRVRKAYDVLQDEQQRRQYDAELAMERAKRVFRTSGSLDRASKRIPRVDPLRKMYVNVKEKKKTGGTSKGNRTKRSRQEHESGKSSSTSSNLAGAGERERRQESSTSSSSSRRSEDCTASPPTHEESTTMPGQSKDCSRSSTTPQPNSDHENNGEQGGNTTPTAATNTGAGGRPQRQDREKTGTSPPPTSAGSSSKNEHHESRHDQNAGTSSPSCQQQQQDHEEENRQHQEDEQEDQEENTLVTITVRDWKPAREVITDALADLVGMTLNLAMLMTSPPPPGMEDKVKFCSDTTTFLFPDDERQFV
ncbi:unnamed protein product [Amoebophrya sp. A120]|nr:unnamed protein product [Amoebophrya sp. A120]|eukprot:GSA120T00003570001.1